MNIYEGYCKNCGNYFQKKHAAQFCSVLCSNRFSAKNQRNYKIKENRYLLKTGLRQCTKCMRVLPVDTKHFYKQKNTKAGIASACKDCVKEYQKKVGITKGVHEKIQTLHDQGLRRCVSCKKTLRHDYFYKCKSNKWGLSTWCRDCKRKYSKKPEIRKRKAEQWRTRMQEDADYREKVLQYRRKHESEQRKTNPEYRLRCNMRTLIHNALRGIDKKGKSWQDLTGYTVGELKRNLQGKMKKGMSWSNYGTEWHVDHKIPISKWGITSVRDLAFKECWDLKNLQPLWKEENLRKSDKISGPFQLSLPMQVRQ